jgi:UDP-N-acetylglucosamine transferase subunit ALG13
VIFATVGSHPTFKFERLLRALEFETADDLVVQYGPGVPPANAKRAVPWMSFEEALDHVARASHIVSHAGVGTILCAIAVGHMPVVLPRLRRFDETVDDHQLKLARTLSQAGRVIMVEEASQLEQAIARAPERAAAPDPAGGELIAAVREELLDAGRRPG